MTCLINDNPKGGCVKIGMPSYLLKNAQRPNFPKLGLCHVVKISYLYDTNIKLCKSSIFARILQIKRFFFQKESTWTYIWECALSHVWPIGEVIHGSGYMQDFD